MPDSTESRLARIEERLTGVAKGLVDITTELRAASESRRRTYEAQETMRSDIMVIRARLDHVEADLRAIRPTTDEYKALRERVTGAGTLGVILWRLGGIMIGFAAGAASIYTYLTGRPPP